MATSSSYHFGPFHFDGAAYRLQADGRPVPLSPRVMDLLRLLASRPAELVTRDDIVRELWPDVAVTDNAITQAVSELRQALGDPAASPRYVQTVPRRGYRFIAPVQTSSGTPTPAALTLTRDDDARSGSGGRRVAAVADFENLSGLAADDWMTAGIAETVTSGLHDQHHFRIVDRVQLPAAARRSSLDAALGAGVDLLIVGAYQRSGEQLRMTARVLETRTGGAVAHARVDGAVGDLFALQDGIVSQLSRSLRAGRPPGLRSARDGAHDTSSLEAYRAVTEGRLALEALEPARVAAAIEAFERAIAADPRYAPSYVGLALAHFAAYESTRAVTDPRMSDLRAAIAYARRALALDPQFGDAHGVLALLLASAGRRDEALHAGRVAVALEPLEWRRHFHHGVAAWGKERLAAMEEVVRLFPEFPDAYLGSAMVYVARHQLDVAEEVLRQGLAVHERNASGAERFPAHGLHQLLGLIALERGDVGSAQQSFRRELASTGQTIYADECAANASEGQGCVLLATGDRAGAVASFKQALARVPERARVLIHLVAAHQSGGERAAAVRAVERAERAIDRLRHHGRADETALCEALLAAARGRPEDAAARLARGLDGTPPGPACWTVPIEPLLAATRALPCYAPVRVKIAPAPN